MRNRIIIDIDDSQETTDGGIFLPEMSQTKSTFGQVVAVGDGEYNKHDVLMPMTVKVGDRVLIDKHAGTQIELDQKVYTILKEDEVLGIVND